MINRLRTSKSRNFFLKPGSSAQILPMKDNNPQTKEEHQNEKNVQTQTTGKKILNPRTHKQQPVQKQLIQQTSVQQQPIQQPPTPSLPKNIAAPKVAPNGKAPRQFDVKPPSDSINTGNTRNPRNNRKTTSDKSIYVFLDRNSALPSLSKGNNEKYSNITPIAIQLSKLANMGIQTVASNKNCINIITDKNELFISQTIINEERNSMAEFNMPPNFSQIKILSVSCGAEHTVICAMKDKNFFVLGLGSNKYGQLGYKKEVVTISQFRPINISNRPRFSKVCCGNNFTFLLTDTAQLYSFGQNKHGQLGLGIYDDIVTTPTFCNSLNGAPIIDVACGVNHSLALSSTGLVFAAGSNDQGQLGISSQSDQPIFRIVDTLANVYIVSIAAYDNFSAAIDEFGTLYAWGGKWGFIPQPLTFESSENGKVRNEKIVDVALGLDGRIAVLTTTNKLILSGYFVNNQQVPELVDIVSPHSPFVKIFSGGQYFFALTSTSKPLPLLSSEISKDTQNNPLYLLPPQKNEVKGRLRSSKRILTLNSSYFPSVLTSPNNKQIFSLVYSSLSAINTSFVLQNFTEVMANDSSGIDVDGVINAYNLILESKELLSILTSSFNNLLRQLLNNPPSLRRPTNMRFLLIGLLHPSISESKEGFEFWDNLLSLIEKLNVKSILQQWLSTLNTDHLSRILTSLKYFLSAQTEKVENSEDLYLPEYIKSVKAIEIVWNASTRTKKLSFDNFYHDEINSKIDLEEEFKIYMKNKQLSKTTIDSSRLVWCYTQSASWILNADTKQKFINVYSKAKWLKNAGESILVIGPYHFFREEDVFFVLNIDRENVLKDTFDQIFKLENPKVELKKKLKVAFKNEPAVDAGGVQREFFELVVNELLDQKMNLFKSNGDFYYFNKDSTDSKSLQMYQLSGIIIGLGISNGCLINIRFPTIVYKKLKGQTVGFKDLIEYDTELYTSLENILNYEGDVENDMCLMFEYGDVPLIENGSNIPVTKANRYEYVEAVSKYVLTTSIEAQFNKFKEGLFQCVGKIVSNLFRPEELALLIGGREDLDFYALMKATKYEGYTENSPTVQAFWRIVFTRLTDEEKKKLLYFVTSSPRAPIGGLGKVNFVIARDGEKDHIPTSHTCFFMLVLPDEQDEEKLYQKIKIAIENSEGFAFK